MVLAVGGDRPRSCAHVAIPVGHGLGGVLPQRAWIGKLQTIGAENTREGARDPPSRDFARENEASERERQRATSQECQQLQ